MRSYLSFAALALLAAAFSSSLSATTRKHSDTSSETWRNNLPPQYPAAPSEPADVTIAVFNEAEVSPRTVASAEKIAWHVFNKAGIRTVWINCSAADPSPGASCKQIALNQRLDLRIVPSALNMKDSVMGIAFLSEQGLGHQADVFFDGISRLHQQSEVDVATILGHIAAHEIGHLLLGLNSHSLSGLMRASWTRDELLTAARGDLRFSKGQSDLMRARLPIVFAAEFPACKETSGE